MDKPCEQSLGTSLVGGGGCSRLEYEKSQGQEENLGYEENPHGWQVVGSFACWPGIRVRRVTIADYACNLRGIG